MTDNDVRFAADLSTAEGWGFYDVDFQRLVALDPEGCFIARREGVRVGMVCTASYGTHAFIGCLIVKREARGRDVGRMLMQTAIQYLDKKNITTIELDGVIAAVLMYRKLGFKDKYLSYRMSIDEHRNSAAAPFPPVDIPEIVRFDLAKTGIERSAVLYRLLQEYSEGICAVYDEGIRGYGLIRQREGGFSMIGPLVAEDDTYADELVRRLLSRAAHERVVVGVPGVARRAVDVMLGNGFLYTQPSLRMYRGERIEYESCVYGILGPEKG
ncbi:MAG: GNAT family N-acetyltransferase [candidate division WOR-3 bacterium]|nr:MAG: GNAT family N-acetyltransferase [candidate division WOR-3 bacterium]